MFCWKSKDQIVWVYSGFPILFHSSVCQSVCWYFCCLVVKSCLILCDPMATSYQASLSFAISQSLLKLMSIESVMPSNYLFLCHPLLLLQSFPALGSFPMTEWILGIRWPKYWSFSFSISPSNEYSGLISFSKYASITVLYMKWMVILMSLS